jgi:adenine-specific DNA methylase
MESESVRRLETGPRGEPAKALGAFYTDAQVADFLVAWAVRSPHDCVIDPSFGGGVFLRSCCKHLRAIGGEPARQVFGIEVDAAVYKRIASKLIDEFGVRTQHLYPVDFFWFDPAVRFDVVVGNPPFIRYQRFSGDVRRQALECARAQGVRLSELSSSWAPFIVHSTAMLKRGGRLGMVVPAEIGYAGYARPILDFLRRTFAQATFLTFRKKLFPDLSEDTLLLLAEGKDQGPARFLWRDFVHAGELAACQIELELRPPVAHELDAAAVAHGKLRLVEYLLPNAARELYRELKTADTTRRLGELADVGIGYVTGANDFFHVSPVQARCRHIPEQFLRPAIRRGRSLVGLRFDHDDWIEATKTGEAGRPRLEPGGVPDVARRRRHAAGPPVCQGQPRMSLRDAVLRAGMPPAADAPQAQKKRYSEVLSKHLSQEVAGGLRGVGFRDVRPRPGGPRVGQVRGSSRVGSGRRRST